MNALLNELKGELLQVFEHLHENAQVSWLEIETAKYLSNLLNTHGFTPIPFGDCTGFTERVMEHTIVQTNWAENLFAPYMSAGGEDYHFYTIKRPKNQSNDARTRLQLDSWPPSS
jgi:hypothetical protein